MTDKIYLKTFEKCPGLLCFPLVSSLFFSIVDVSFSISANLYYFEPTKLHVLAFVNHRYIYQVYHWLHISRFTSHGSLGAIR